MDWFASLFTLVGVWFLAEKKQFAWFFGMTGNVLWVIYATVLTWQLPLAILNVVFFGLNVRGYFKWGGEEKDTPNP